MSATYRNRLSGAEVRQPGSQPLLGVWRVMREDDATVFLNSVPITSGDSLVPDARGHWSLLDDEGQQRQAGTFGTHQLPGELEATSITALGRQLQALVDRGAGWLDWMDITPVVPGMSDQVEPQPLEKSIREHLGHLEQVCRRPRAHLRVEIERELVSRARRVPTQAANFLAAHTEDWERPTLRAVHPRRVLSMVREDQLDIYENRVTARLVDHLLAYLRRREHAVRSLRWAFEQAGKDMSQVSGGSHWRLERICRLWGHAVDVDERQRKANQTLQELEWLRFKLLGLMNSVLYEGVPRRAQVSDTLTVTNILANDTHYRHVAALWREWSRRGRVQTRSPSHVYRDHQDLCTSFDRFCLLLVVRAFEQLRYEPVSLEEPLRPGEALELSGPDGTVNLRWEADGAVTLSTEAGAGVRIVALPALISGGTDLAGMRRYLDELTRDVKGLKHPTLVLHPTSLGGDAAKREEEGETVAVLRRLHMLGHEQPRARRGDPWMLPASPWDLGSVERVARALRWVLASGTLQRYPPRLEAPPAGLLDVNRASGWLQPAGVSGLVVVRPPADDELESLDVEGAVQRAQEEVRRLEQEHAEASEAAREADKRGKGATRQLNVKKSTLNAQLTQARSSCERVQSFQDALREGLGGMEGLRRCPTCGTQVDLRRNFHARTADTFHCTCPGCSTNWGIRLCGKCGERYPILQPDVEVPEAMRLVPGWVDKVLGADVLALPCLHSADAFVCSQCGQCPCQESNEHERAG